MKDILLIDKPVGVTSFDVVRQLRKKLGVRKIGHAGTLDPLASGLLIVGVGEGTKRLGEFLKLPKTYEVEILLGVRTDTGDMEGAILEEQIYTQILKNLSIVGDEESILSKITERLEKVLKEIGGRRILLPVPRYSAVKRGGEPLYKKARRGEHFEPPKKKMEIRHTELVEVRLAPSEVEGRDGEPIVLAVRMEVGSGAYVRSIAEEIGRRLALSRNGRGEGIPATVSKLRRTKIGLPRPYGRDEFDVKDAQKLEEI